ncbi:hypothetical protein P389DRAFT_83827 [Cystobasidium minutum MCA 4210]|uniref:uncharacterized protein n=1 Tax=Cystobasidium minutum MCA 4210 TaxID=1397322 RepID=UPI0034CE2C7D|eukprot:jgi/Rhomi1/83827/CE83826_144
MQSTPTKKQATQNGILFTPERRDPNDMRGSMALATPEELKAQLASRPRSVRSAVSQGYSFPSRASLSATRSEPELGSSAFYPGSPSPSPSSSSHVSRPTGLMPLCNTFSSPSHSPSTRPSYELSTSNIFETAKRVHESYLINWSASSSSNANNFGFTSRNSSPRKRGQMEDDEDTGIPMSHSGMKVNGLVGARAYNDDEMDEDGDATMMDDGDVPLSRSGALPNQSPTLSFGTGSGTNSASSSISSFGSNNDPFSSFGSHGQNASIPGERREMKTLPRRQALGKTQSLPVDAFMNHLNSSGNGMQLAPDIFDAEDGF